MSLDLDRYTLAQNEKLRKQKEEEKNKPLTDEDVVDDDKEDKNDRRLPKGSDVSEVDDSNASVEFEPGGGMTTSQELKKEKEIEPAPRERPKSKQKETVRTKQSTSRSETAQIRDFPRDLLDIARSEFPQATTQTDALAAYVAVKSGEPVNNLSESVRELVKNYEGDQTLLDVETRMKNLETQVKIMSGVMQELELGVGFIIYDRLGFRTGNPANPRSVDLLEGDMMDLITRLREQTVQSKQQERLRTGRTIR